MKRISFVFIIFCFAVVFAAPKADCTLKMFGTPAIAKAVFAQKSFVFMGVDFSRVRLIGDHGHGSGTNMPTDYIRDTYFNAYNEIILNETKKYDVEAATGGRKITYDFNSVVEINKTADTSSMKIITKTEPLDMEVIRGMIKKYKTASTEQIGIVLIADQMNKYDKEAHYYVIFFDIQYREIVFGAYVKGSAGGFGYKNFWVNTIHEVLKSIKKKDWEYWESKIKG
mgnify:CR=1 FL=1